MNSEEKEAEELRSVALENARSILRARQRAERDLLAAREVLEQTTRELAASLAMMRATLESTFDGILVTNSERKVTGFNEKYIRMWKLPREAVDAGDYSQLLALCSTRCLNPQQYLARTEEILAESPAETGDEFELDDGRILERRSCIQYLDGKHVGRVWSFRDVTAQKRAEAELRHQREWFQVTLASIGDAVITTDLSGAVTFLNPVAERMTGWRSSDASGVPLTRVFHIINEYSRQVVENPVGRVLREGSIIGLANHTILIAKDGSEVAIEDSAAPIRDPRGSISGAVMVFHDVTARRHAEEALRKADRRKDEFLATLAHELRNPLAPIRQAALISKAQGATEAQKRWSQEVIDRQVRHMALLLDDLLDISRVTHGTLVLRIQPTELASMIDAAVETARPAIDAKRHTLAVDIPNDSTHIHADPLRLAQILANLLTNAAKYTDPRGHIRLTVGLEPAEVVIRVTDSGIGISAEALPTIFEMFAQVPSARDRSEGGLGIGLALTKGLVELHGGKIAAHSAGPGRGSEFTVRLPMGAAVEVRREELDGTPSPRVVHRRILLADDNRDAAESMAALLELEGHEVTVVRDGPAAFAAFKAVSPDIVLLDIGMPGLTGYEVARMIRQEHPDSGAKVIAITGWGQQDDKARALAAGFDNHLTKPVDLQLLLDLVQPEAAHGSGTVPRR
jgi:PAS domain S-box-containing protein